MKQEKKIMVVLCVVFVLAAGVIYVSRDHENANSVAYEQLSSTPMQTASAKKKVGTKSTRIAVYVCGAVKKPGVYELQGSARICDALQAAGGFTKKAAKEAVNLARVVSDGEQIVIPKKSSGGRQEVTKAADSGEAGQTSSSLVNINQAEKETLMTLPGVGESKAVQIIAYRTEHGSFQKIEDIMNISGIKEGVFNQIKDKITV